LPPRPALRLGGKTRSAGKTPPQPKNSVSYKAQRRQPQKRETAVKHVVITHPEMGIFLGSFLGMGVWSKKDSAGQDAAVVFPSEVTARAFLAYLPDGGRGFSLVPVAPDIALGESRYASVGACVRAGLDPWMDAGTRPANTLPL
jgi:hypothetical protein